MISMNRIVLTLIVAVGFTVSVGAQDKEKSGKRREASRENTSEKIEAHDKVSSAVLEAQVLLDRAMFSPGAIDGLMGTNAAHSLKAFQKANALEMTGKLDKETSAALYATSDAVDALQGYMITEADWARDYIEEVPEDMEAQAKLPALSYTTITELLAERFHCTPELLVYLNPDATWTAGSAIAVPNVYPTWVRVDVEQLEKWVAAKYEQAGKSDRSDKSDKSDGSDQSDDSQEPDKLAGQKTDDGRITSSGLHLKPRGDLTVVVTKEDTSLNVFDETSRLIFHAPITAGSEHDPLPLGEWKVNGTERYPKFNYNPELFWDAEESDQKAKIPAGPNSPVGVAWIDISKPHYGLHGTPNPEKIGYTESHGCVRLTNWDVLRLADMVKPETKVLFVEKAEDLDEMIKERAK